MNNTSNSRIENGILKKYIGPGIDVVIPDGVSDIGRGAFKGRKKLTSVVIPESVKSIGESAFSGCSKLKTVIIPNSVTSIGCGAFEDCISLISMTIPSSVTDIGNQAFHNCSSLLDVEIPDSVTSIGCGVFEDCISLTSITIPSSVTDISEKAFYNCRSLMDVKIPHSVTCIGLRAFQMCVNLKNVNIPDSVKNIECRAFEDCFSLEKINIPASVESIGEAAFNECRALADANGYVVVNGVLYDYFGSDEDIVIASDVTSISDYAFSFCFKLKSVTIPESVTSIGVSAFYDCTSLMSITIPKSVTCIDNWAFAECEKLKCISLPEGITSIHCWMFSRCRCLTSLTVMGNVKSIESYAFNDCEELIEIFAPNTSHVLWRSHGFGMVTAKTFISRCSEYANPSVVKEYLSYISSQRRNLLPFIFEKDAVEIIRMLAEAQRITEKNLEKDYLLLAKQSKAEKCTAFLMNLAEEWMGADKKAALFNVKGDKLWDGEHFSYDGKKMLKYPETPGCTKYEVPEGTEEICRDAFFETELQEIRIPESVKTIHNYAFAAKTRQPLFIRLPAGLKKLSLESFVGRYRYATYYIATDNIGLIKKCCSNSWRLGTRYPVYLGGGIDDLPKDSKKYAVMGFLFADQHGLKEMRQWRDSYLSYIKRNEKTYRKLALENEYFLRLMLDEKLLSENGVDELLSTFDQDHPELAAALLEYKKTCFGKKKRKDEFTLADNDPAFKRLSAMAERREQIKGQIGIKGLAFVSSGWLENFGHIDGYTGAHDFSDLKKYIEAHGGYYRGAVSSRTDYLICNNPSSQSTKCKKAKELGVPVITEEEFLKMAKETE